ncbi:helix-turn-helix domain-containing protein [Jiella sonneratiae]|uniref:Helix-turn-helix domain-containing protein n=1 Tax=Jiella sonneratiae TaxID=2816856 RepID=A0ABS3JAL0_9HYPH|nr:helix-turn-helix domain-containing protein [Jiella sonneratiae]MBO0906175.1 helix-turn-helix domain-containing protein [Jiella sonneratiae]
MSRPKEPTPGRFSREPAEGVASSPCAAAPSPLFTAKAAIWADFRAGLISLKEAERRSAAVSTPERDTASPDVRTGFPAAPKGRPPLARPRHSRPAPRPSRQYANHIATTAMRDDRLTPGAKALLVVLRARCGKGRVTEAAKATLAATMSRSSRTVRRYLLDLERLGYIATRIRTCARGLHTGLVITLTEKVLPFFAEQSGLAAWLGETPEHGRLPFRPFVSRLPLPIPERVASFPGNRLAPAGVTVLSPNNQSHKDPFFKRRSAREKWGCGRAPGSA